MIDYATLIGSYGFPIIMVLYLITRGEKVLNANTQSNINMSQAIVNNTNAVNNLKEFIHNGNQ